MPRAGLPRASLARIVPGPSCMDTPNHLLKGRIGVPGVAGPHLFMITGEYPATGLPYLGEDALLRRQFTCQPPRSPTTSPVR
jgi:hypothetical protein